MSEKLYGNLGLPEPSIDSGQEHDLINYFMSAGVPKSIYKAAEECKRSTELFIRKVFLGEVPVDNEILKYVKKITEEQWLFRGFRRLEMQRNRNPKQLQTAIKKFLQMYAVGCQKFGLTFDNFDFDQIWQWFYFDRQESLAREHYQFLSEQLAGFSLLETIVNGLKAVKVWQKQLKVYGLKAAIPNLDEWIEFLKNNPTYSEAAILLLCFTTKDYWETQLDQTALHHLRIDGDQLVVESGGVLIRLPIDLGEESLFDLLSLLSDGLIDLTKKNKHKEDETPAASAAGRFRPREEADQIWREFLIYWKCSLSTAFYAPLVRAHLDSSFESMISDQARKKLQEHKGSRWIVLFEGDIALFFDRRTWEFVTSGRINDEVLNQQFIQLFGKAFEKIREAYQAMTMDLLFFQDGNLQNLHHPIFKYGLCHKNRMEVLVAEHQRELRAQIEAFQQGDRKAAQQEMRQQLAQIAPFQQTLETLIHKSGVKSEEDFYRRHQNISSGMVAFLSLFDCRELTEEQIRELNLFKQVSFNSNGANIPLAGGSILAKRSVFVPFAEVIKPLTFQICLRHISVRIYLTLLLKKIGARLYRKVDSQQDKVSVAGKTVFYSLNERKPLSRQQTVALLQRIVLPNGLISEDKPKLVLFSYGIDDVRLYTESMRLIVSAGYSPGFQQEVLKLQIDAATEILEQTSVNEWMKNWLLVPEQKAALRHAFQAQGGQQHGMDRLNAALHMEGYPFKFLSSEEVFEGQLRGVKGITFLNADEAMAVLKVLSWFPKGAFAGVKFFAKRCYTPDRANINDPNVDMISSQSLEQLRMLKYFRTEMKKRLEEYRDLGGIVYREGVLTVDEIYFLALAQNDPNAIRGLLKNLIQWIGEHREQEIHQGKAVYLRQKEFVESMVKYLNVRMGQLALDAVDQETRERFHLFDHLFLTEHDRPTFNQTKLSSK